MNFLKKKGMKKGGKFNAENRTMIQKVEDQNGKTTPKQHCGFLDTLNAKIQKGQVDWAESSWPLWSFAEEL